MMQQAGTEAAAAAKAERMATAALEAAERALQAANEGQPRAATPGGVSVSESPTGAVIVIPGENGAMRRIVLSQDNREIVALEGISAAPVMPRRKDIPDGVQFIVGLTATAAVAISVLGPIARAFSRRLERRPEQQAANDAAQRLAAIEQAVEAVAVEVERISEGQRFTAKLLADRERQPVEPR